MLIFHDADCRRLLKNWYSKLEYNISYFEVYPMNVLIEPFMHN